MVHSPRVHQGRGRGHRGHPALADSIIGCRRGFVHALGARAERDESVLVFLIRACLRACLWHLLRSLWRPVLALWCVYQSACKVASYLLGAKSWVLKVLRTRVGAHGARPGVGRGQLKGILSRNSLYTFMA